MAVPDCPTAELPLLRFVARKSDSPTPESAAVLALDYCPTQNRAAAMR